MKQLLSVGLTLATLVVVAMVHGQEDLRGLEEEVTRKAVERVNASIVQIETIGGLGVVDDVQTSNGPTTGLVVSKDGYIVSSTFNPGSRVSDWF